MEFYKKKLFIIPAVLMLSLFLVSAAVYAYFHTVQSDLVVSEARSSDDIDFTLNCVSGDTVTETLTIHNAAQVQLCAVVEYNETSNSGVTYTHNLPQDIVLTANSDTAIDAEFTCDELTDEGTATGIIGYSKIACP